MGRESSLKKSKGSNQTKYLVAGGGFKPIRTFLSEHPYNSDIWDVCLPCPQVSLVLTYPIVPEDLTPSVFLPNSNPSRRFASYYSCWQQDSHISLYINHFVQIIVYHFILFSPKSSNTVHELNNNDGRDPKVLIILCSETKISS